MIRYCPSLFRFLSFFLISGLTLSACTFRKEPESLKTGQNEIEKSAVASKAAVKAPGVPVKDRILQGVVRVFEQADAIHREAWWVIGEERRPAGKSPFGKVQRALMSEQKIKLSNKSFFRCDRYVVKRDILSAAGYPQKAEVFEKCSEKAPAKQIADWSLEKMGELKVTFHTENLEEVLGLGATILMRRLECQMNFNELDQLLLLRCQAWAQDRGQGQTVRLDTYEYRKDNKSMLKLRGKVHENLTEIRKIDVDIPLEGKIKVTETELYAAEEPTPTPTPATTPAPAKPAEAPHQRTQDPDLMMAQKRAQERAAQGLPPFETPEEKKARLQNENADPQEGDGNQEPEEHPQNGPETQGPGTFIEYNQEGEPQTTPPPQELPRAR